MPFDNVLERLFIRFPSFGGDFPKQKLLKDVFPKVTRKITTCCSFLAFRAPKMLRVCCNNSDVFGYQKDTLRVILVNTFRFEFLLALFTGGDLTRGSGQDFQEPHGSGPFGSGQWVLETARVGSGQTWKRKDLTGWVQ